VSCLFCWSTQGEPLSREHLISQPVADAFGIDRNNELATFDGWVLDESPTRRRSVPMTELAVRLPCRACNSGWMNELEHNMAAVARWARAGRNGITAPVYDGFLRWLLKTYIVFTALDGGIRRFGTESDDFHMLPEVTRAHLLWERSPEALDGVTFAFAKSWREGVSYSFGNPTVVPQGEQYAGCRTAGALVLQLGQIVSCVVVASPLANSVSVPAPYRALRAGDTYRRLRSAAGILDPELIVVDNGEHNIHEINAALLEWAVAEDSARAARDEKH
jgi:hypothetical protein